MTNKIDKTDETSAYEVDGSRPLPPTKFNSKGKMDTPDKSEYVVAGIAAIILLEALTVALVIGFYFGRSLS